MAKTDIKLYITDENGKNGKDLFQYSQFSFSQNIDAVVDTFSVTCIDPEFRIKVGHYLYFDINRELVIRGLIQKRAVNISKTSTAVTVSGKSVALLLVEQYCHNLDDFNGKTPKFIVDSLIAQTDFLVKQTTIPTIFFTSDADPEESVSHDEGYFTTTVNVDANNRNFTRKNQVIYDDDFKSLPAYGQFSINAGDTVWSKITEIITVNGMQAYFKPIGDLIIGELKKERDEAGVNFKIIHKKNNINNNVLTANFIEDISDRYTELQVMTQLENGSNKTIKILDKTAPLQKLMVFSVANDQDPEKIGIEARELQRIGGYRVNYTVSGFTQAQKLWAVNRLVHVEDSFLDIRQNLVIQSRVFTFSLTDGAKTNLVLSLEKDLKNKTYPPETVPGVTVES
jgi:prophage tail gpP-like protein